jgi:carboxyl-terminal processing protease
VQQPQPTDTPGSTDSQPTESEPTGEFEPDDLAILWEAWELIKSEYDGEIPSDTDLAYAALRGVIEELGDPYTRFSDPEAAQQIRESLQGSYEGIGALVDENEEGFTVIVRPFAGHPADLAGVKAGDIVLAVNGESMAGKTLDEVIALIKGPEGTDVTITFRRPDLADPFDVTITRQRIEIPLIESSMLDEGIAYVHLTSFGRNAESQLTLALNDLLSQNPRGLILDLRDNPGGFLDQSVAVADLFLPGGVILFERSDFYDIDQTYEADGGDLAESIPLVVLVNAGSASASEIVAGALQDNGRAILVGEVTFGKGSVQLPHDLTDGSELRVTIARWYTPENQSIDGEGVTPDIEVETPETLGGEGDTQLQRAIEYLLNGQ